MLKEIQLHRKYRIMVIGENWHGSDCTGLARGFRELGHAVDLIGTDQFFLKTGQSLPARMFRRAVSPFCVRQFNSHIICQLSIVQPNIVVVFKGNYVRPETLQQIKESDAWLTNFYPDVSFFAHKSVDKDTWKHYHYIFTTKTHGGAEMREQLGFTNVEYLQFGFDKFVHRPINSVCIPSQIKNDVSFIGGWSPNKERYLCGLASNDTELDLKIWGGGWNYNQRSELKKSIQGFPIYGDYYALAINGSKINLGLLTDKQGFAEKGDHISDRTFHIPASGGFCLHERNNEVLEYYEEGKEIACFESPEELVDKVRYYLANEQERLQIAKAGYERCINENSFSNRAQVIIDKYESENE